VLGGPVKEDKAFFFVSYETQVLNASKEASFAVPTIEQRGIYRTGATGLFADCLTADPGFNIANCTPANSSHFFPEFGVPSKRQGDAVFSLFPFPNNPTGVYGINTYTELLPASARGNVASGKYDQNFNLWGMPQTFTARYNFTQDWRQIPVTGGALFSTLKPRVRTQNFSTFLTSELSSKMNNVLRLSYGRTRLVFDEVRDPFLIPSEISPNEPFLLNAPRLLNRTVSPLPIAGGSFGFTGVPNTGAVLYEAAGTTECGITCVGGTGLGRVGQINVAGFSPIGVDVNNFPQKRVNNTYQLADALGYRAGMHSLTFGADIRRVELNSDLPRNSRTLLSFNGAPELDFNTGDPTGNFLTGTDFVASGAPSGAFLSLLRSGSSAISLRYYEYNLFGQDQWNIRPNLSVSFGLRYEYNTPPRETHNLIEKTFSDPLLDNANAVGLKNFIQGRARIFDSDRNNFAPRVGIAWSPDWFGHDRSTVIRAGFGIFNDQILGAVVSQSRNVYPNFVTVNTSGFTTFDMATGFDFLTYFNPARGGITLSNGTFVPLIQPGTLNTLNPALSLALVLDCFSGNATSTCTNTFPPSLSTTLPDRTIKTPSAEQYAVTFEQQLSSNMLISAAYVGTRGHNLLRVSTPNLGPNNFVLPFAVFSGGDVAACFPVVTAACDFNSIEPRIAGFVGPPGNATTNFDRPVPNVGPIFIYDSGGRSRYDAFQLQLRGRFHRGLQYQANYTLSKARDDASDVFDLAGASSLPQDNSRAGEYGASNFDARHRFAYNFIYDFQANSNNSKLYRTIFHGLQIASTGFFQTGQPFTVNSIFDVNLDGNLTDRLNSTQGITVTGNRRQPLAIATGTNLASLLATPGEDGSVGRNTFRAGNILSLDFSVVKNFQLSETRHIIFRMDVFNFINRANYGIPVRFLEAPGFGQATDTVTPGRRIQFALKFSF
ncbi:MAG: TonB-dependent receptor, partial [Pyrinomonadaceae bacterium]